MAKKKAPLRRPRDAVRVRLTQDEWTWLETVMSLVHNLDVQARCPPLVALLARLRDEMAADPELTEARIATARETYANDEVEVDDDAAFSESENGGVWVQGWLYVDSYDVKMELKEMRARKKKGTPP